MTRMPFEPCGMIRSKGDISDKQQWLPFFSYATFKFLILFQGKTEEGERNMGLGEDALSADTHGRYQQQKEKQREELYNSSHPLPYTHKKGMIATVSCHSTWYDFCLVYSCSFLVFIKTFVPPEAAPTY